jgi:hypothetical protein
LVVANNQVAIVLITEKTFFAWRVADDVSFTVIKRAKVARVTNTIAIGILLIKRIRQSR